MPTSIPVLWWDNTVVAAISEEEPATIVLPADGADALHAFCGFIESLTPTPKNIRLFYSADSLDHVVTTCPKKATRHILRDILKTKYPVLNHAGTAWAVHDVTGQAAATTILYIEQEPPRLQRLRTMLGDHGITLVAAFPLLTLVEAAPPVKGSNKPTLALLHTEQNVAVFWTTAEGDRHATFFQREDTDKRAFQELITGFSTFEGKTSPNFIIVNAGGPPFDTADLPQKPTKIFAVAEFLKHGRDLSARSLTNLIPPVSRLSVDYILYAAAAVLFAFAALNGLRYMAALRAAEADRQLQKAEEQQLTLQISALQANKAHIDQAQAMLNEVATLPAVKGPFLDALGHTRPVQITIHSATLNESTWTVTGTLHEGVNVEKGPFQTFITQLGKAGPWTLGPESKVTVLKQPEFTLNGTFP